MAITRAHRGAARTNEVARARDRLRKRGRRTDVESSWFALGVPAAGVIYRRGVPRSLAVLLTVIVLGGCDSGDRAQPPTTPTDAPRPDPERAAEDAFAREAARDTTRGETLDLRSRRQLRVRRPGGFRLDAPAMQEGAMWAFVPIKTPPDQEGLGPDNSINVGRWTPDRPVRTAAAAARDYVRFLRRELPSSKPRLGSGERHAGLRMAVVKGELGGSDEPLDEVSRFFMVAGKPFRVTCLSSPLGDSTIDHGCLELLDALRPASR